MCSCNKNRNAARLMFNAGSHRANKPISSPPLAPAPPRPQVNETGMVAARRKTQAIRREAVLKLLEGSPMRECIPSGTSKYPVGSLLFNIYKATYGCIEEVKIKEIKAICNLGTYGRSVFLYKDNLNALWNESDLCTEAEAFALVTAYKQSH